MDSEYPDNKLTGATFEVYKDSNANGKQDDGDELLGHEGLYFRKPPAMFDFVHIINIFLYHVYLFQQLFLRSFDALWYTSICLGKNSSSHASFSIRS